jgi:hypothetical protein
MAAAARRSSIRPLVQDPMKHGVDLDIGQLLAGLQAHVIQRAAHGIDLAAGKAVGIGHDAGDRQHILGRGAPGDDRGDIFAAQRDDLVEMRILIGIQGFPPCQRGFPLRAFGAWGRPLT